MTDDPIELTHLDNPLIPPDPQGDYDVSDDDGEDDFPLSELPDEVRTGNPAEGEE